MTLWEIYDKAWEEWIKYHKEMDEYKNATVKAVKKDQDREEVLWDIVIDEYEY